MVKNVHSIGKLFKLLLLTAFTTSFILGCSKSSHKKHHIIDDTKFCTDLMDASLNPLGPQEWHLYNYGNVGYATPYTDEEFLAAYGQDINAYSVLKDDCLSGKNVRVAVVDSGLEIRHPSLAPNIDNRSYKSVTWSTNYRDNYLPLDDPSPTELDADDHGTMVAGIIAMRSNLGFGGSGVAPRAILTGYNIVHDDAQAFANFYEALGGSEASKNNDIFNMSYGYESLVQFSADDNSLSLATLAMFKRGTRSLRNGKGAIYVKAAGNGFVSDDEESCDAALMYQVSCYDTNMEPESTTPEVIVVGAVNSFGKKTSYSTTGASLWVVAPGGEFGFDKKWLDNELLRFGKAIDWPLFPSIIGEPGIISTDMMGFHSGSSQKTDMNNYEEIFNAQNPFNAGLLPENANHNYTNIMNGTSAATPIVSGAVAILLEANPNLTWRDIKYILATTATQNDPEFSGIIADLPKGKFQFEQGWITNAAGYHFSNWYGFGRVNLKAAVAMAKNYNSHLGSYVEKPWWPKEKSVNRDIPSENYEGIIHAINVPTSQNLKIESVQILVSITSKYVGDVAIEVTSPSNTKSIIWHAGNGFSNNTSLKEMVMQTNAFYGENSFGDWTIRFINTGIHNQKATLEALQIKVIGDVIDDL